MRLNGWQRIGIVLSVVWMVGAAIQTRNNEMEFWHRMASSEYDLCMQLKSATQGACWAEMTDTRQKAYKPYWPNIAFNAIAPVIAGWILIYSILGIFRWIKAGFKRDASAKPTE